MYPKTENAIKNAIKIYKDIGKHTNPAIEELSTTVFELVEQIKKFI